MLGRYNLRRSVCVIGAITGQLALLTASAFGQVSVLTQHNDNSRTGANTSESILTPANVNVNSFGKLFTVALDASVNGQPLYVPHVTIGGAAHNTVYASTSGNSNGSLSSVYAIDGDTGAQLWRHQFTNSAEWTTCAPVIDPSTNIIYVLTKDTNDAGNSSLHAIDITTGNEEPGSPIVVAASVAGTGDGSVGGVVTFNTAQENDRPALLLLNGNVYASFAHNTDSFPYHGWIMGYHYNGAGFAQTGVFCTTPNGGDGGIWQAGNGLTADSNGFLYTVTGNGTFDANVGGVDYGMSFLKLNTPSLTVADWFSPHDEASLSNGDQDLGSMGAVGIPGTTRIFGGATKSASTYLLDVNNMGHFNGTTDNMLQRFDGIGINNAVGQQPVVWSTGGFSYVYLWPRGTSLLQFQYDPAVGKFNPAGIYKQGATTSGGSLGISANGTSNGIIWALGKDNVIHAFTAADVTLPELWNSSMNPGRDGVPGFPHWTYPTVVNGKLYAPVGTQIVVFGLLTQGAPATPAGLAASPGNATVGLTWTASAGATSYNVYRGTTAGGESATALATNVTTTRYTDNAVVNGTAYFYKVAAVNAGGTSGQSNEVSATPTAGTGGTGGIAIDCGGAASGTFVTDTDFNGGATSGTGTTIDTSAVANPAPQAVYQSNRFGNFTYTIPGLTAGGTYTVRLHFAEEYWTAAGKRTFNVVINGAQVLTNFDIFAAAGAAFKANVQQFSAVASGSGQIVIQAVTVIDNAQINGIEVIGGGGGGTAPPAPTNLTATAGNSQVSLSWNASTGATSYNVYRGGAQVATGLTATSDTDTGLTNGTAYSYTVAAVNATGTSPMSNTVTATPTAGTGGTGGVSINCGGAAAGAFVADVDFNGGGTQVVTNAIDTSLLTGTVPPQAVLQSNRFGTYTYTIPGLTAGASYNVTLYFAEEYWAAAGKRVFNVAANGATVLTNFDIYATAGAAYKAVQRSFTVTASGTGQIVISTTNVADNAQINGIVVGTGGGGGTPPAAPTGLSAVAGNTQATLSWNASTGALNYNLYRGTTAGGESSTPVFTGISGTAYTDTGLVNGTVYYYKVAAVNATGTSGLSNEASATPTAGGGGGANILIDSGGAASGAWLADIDFAGGGANNWTNAVDTSLLTGTIPPQAVLQTDREGGFTYTIPGLTAGSTHTVTLYFVEQYWTAAGKRVFSVTSNGTAVVTNLDVFAAAGAQFKAIQRSFTATANASGQIVLSFTASVDQAKCSGIAVN